MNAYGAGTARAQAALTLHATVSACRAILAGTGENHMDTDRIEGAGKQVKGAIKDVAGKVTGDTKLQAEGKADKMEGKVQNTVGGAKDAVRDNT